MKLPERLRTAFPSRSRMSTDGACVVRVDEQGDGDTSSDYCQVVAIARPDGRLMLELSPAPLGPDLREFVEGAGGKIEVGRLESRVRLDLARRRQVGLIRGLAEALRRQVGRGRSYLNSNWKWVCRDTAAALHGLADEISPRKRAGGRSSVDPELSEGCKDE